MQGLRIEVPRNAADPEALRRAIDDAFDYRGDVTIELDDGSSVEGYVFDRRKADSLEASQVRLIARESQERRTITYSRIGAVVFSGKDPAAGKTWENWVKRYAEKKLRGESAGIDAEPLD